MLLKCARLSIGASTQKKLLKTSRSNGPKVTFYVFSSNHASLNCGQSIISCSGQFPGWTDVNSAMKTTGAHLDLRFVSHTVDNA